MQEEFWGHIEKLMASSELIIDRPRGSAHPRFSAIIYPLDYGYLQGTSGGDGAGIDVWRGSRPDAQLDGIICTVDSIKRDAEIKLLIGCSTDEKREILSFHNRKGMAAILVERPMP